MPIAPSTSSLSATFNPFLFASVTDDAEAHLNVVSVLARLDIDPWQEAAELSGLGEEVAANQLASLLARCPGVVLPIRDLGMMAERLVALLPRASVAPAPSRGSRFGAQYGFDPRLIIVMALMFEIAAVATLGGSGAHARRDLAVTPQSAGSSPLPSLASPPSTK